MAWQAGDSAEFSKTISETDVYLFAGITGDLNPVHVDAVRAAQSRFGERIAHGMLGASLVCTVLGTRLPGPGTIHLEQTLRFEHPVRLGDTLTARVEVTDIQQRGSTQRIRLATTVTNQDGVRVVVGEALVMPPSPL